MNPRKIAALIDRDKISLEKIGIPALAKIGKIIAEQVTAARNDHASPETIKVMIVRYMARMEPIILDGMVAGHLAGRARTIKLAAQGMAARKHALGAYDEALEYYKKRMTLTPEDVEKLKKLYGQKALSVVKGASDMVEKRAAEAIKESLESGEHVKDAVARLRGALEGTGIIEPSPFLCETLIRSSIGAAYSAGQWNALKDPALAEVHEGFLYVITGDNRVRETHQEWDGFNGPKDHDFWQTHYPLCGYNCRCHAIPTFTEAESNIPADYEPADEGDNPVTGLPWGTPPPDEMNDGLNE